ncbi:unnamed protein product [Ascophyllum nodosum]
MREVALVTSPGGEGIATVLDILTGANFASLKNCLTQPGSTALIAGDYVVSAQVKGTGVHFWAWGTDQPRAKCHTPEKLGPLAVSGDGSLCAGGGVTSGRLYLWEVATGALLRVWDAHYKAVSALTFSLDGCFLYSGGEDAMVSSWNMLAVVDPEGVEVSQTGGGGGGASVSAVWTASEHSLPVTCVHASVGGGRVYTSSLDRSAKAWDACSGRLLLSVSCPAFLRAVVTDPAEAFLFAAGGGGTIFQLDICATSIAATASDAALASSSAGRLEDPEDDDHDGHIDHDSSWGLRLPEGVGTGGIGGRGGGGRLQELRGHDRTVTSLSVTEDSSVLVSGSEDGTVRSWHVASRQCVQQTAVAEKGGGVSEVLLLPLPEALMISGGAVSVGGGVGGRRYKKQSAPLAPFDKFMRTSKNASAGTGNALGFDLAAGCTPVILKGAQHRPRGRLGGGVASRGGEEERETPGPGWGIRAALEALGSRQTAGVGGGSGGGDDRNRGADDREIEERATKMARLEGEIERLRSENLRWQKVNNSLYQKLGVGGKR